MNDKEILEAFFARDEAAIKECRRAYGDALLSVAYNVLGDAELCEECLNDVLLAAWQSIPPAEPQYLFAYLAKITRNQALKRYRRENTEKRRYTNAALALDELYELIPSGESADAPLLAEELAELIDKFLRNLKDTDRRIFLRRYWYFDSVKKIADTFGYKESRVKMILYRTRIKLFERLEGEGYV